jgi:hypothetical protein
MPGHVDFVCLDQTVGAESVSGSDGIFRERHVVNRSSQLLIIGDRQDGCST